MTGLFDLKKVKMEDCKQIVVNIIVSLLFFFTIISFSNYDNALYQTQKNLVGAIGIATFLAIIMIVRKVNIINIPSCIASLVMCLVAYNRIYFWRESIDIVKVVVAQVIGEWIALMIVIDAVKKKDVKGISLNLLSIAYILLTFGMLYRRNGRMEPYLLVFPLGLFALTKFDDKKWEWFVKRFISGCFLCFFYFAIKSFVTVKYIGGHYYGCFTNVGIFGLFAAVMFSVAILSLMISKDTYGYKSVRFVISVVWLVTVCILAWMIGTRAMTVGIVCTVFAMFFLCRKDISRKASLRRIAVIAGIILLAGAFMIVMLLMVDKNAYYQSFDAEKNYQTAGFLAPFHSFVGRINMVARNAEGSNRIERIMSMLDLFTSGRLTIAKYYIENFNFDGNPYSYFVWGDYYIFSAHNNYIQYLFDYGYYSFVELMTLMIGSLVVFVKNYIRTKNKILYLFPVLWILATMGGWIGEAANFYYPSTFFSLMFITKNIFWPQTGNEEA